MRCCFLLFPVVYCSLLVALTSKGFLGDLFLVVSCYSLLVLDLLSGCYQETPLGAINQALTLGLGPRGQIARGHSLEVISEALDHLAALLLAYLGINFQQGGKGSFPSDNVPKFLLKHDLMFHVEMLSGEAVPIIFP